MKNKTKMAFIIIFLTTNFNRCMETHYPIYITNNSDHSIGYLLCLGGNTCCYPDTILPRTNFSVFNNIMSGRKQSISLEFEWEKVILELPKDTLSVFIFHTDILNKYDWEEVRDNYMILRRYDLSLEDLKLLKRSIPFPPTEAMKDIKMYPPYGSE